jgi:hypothetical protein
MCWTMRYAATVWMVSMMVGCSHYGPAIMHSGQQPYTEALQQARDEQMLANLVRLRYMEMPVFLQISSINTQFALGGNIGASGTLNEGATPNVLGLSGGMNYEERPTITYALPESRQYLGRLLAPLGASQLAVLAQAGWGADTVMRSGVKRINGLAGVLAGASSPRRLKQRARFLEAVKLMTDLRDDGLAELSYGMKMTPTSSPTASLTGRGIAEAQAAFGGEFYTDKSGMYVLYTFKQLLYLLFSGASDYSPKAKRLRQLLQLDPKRYNFALIDSDRADDEKDRLYAHKATAALDPQAVWTELGMQNRSMMEVMSLLSKAVETPKEHIETGVVKGDAIASDLFAVRCSASMPSDAAVKIRRRGYWFYIDATDHRSKDTFALLNALLAVTAGTVPGADPVLTLPIGG